MRLLSGLLHPALNNHEISICLSDGEGARGTMLIALPMQGNTKTMGAKMIQQRTAYKLVHIVSKSIAKGGVKGWLPRTSNL